MKRPTWGGFKASKKPRNPFAAPPPPPPPAPRRYEFERALCQAIENRRLVSMRYEDDFAAGTFQPEGLYHSTKNKICVAGVQINNPAEPTESNEPRVFEVGTSLR